MQVHGKDVKNLIDLVERSMTKANAYGNTFVGTLREKLNSEFATAKGNLDMSANILYNKSLVSQ